MATNNGVLISLAAEDTELRQAVSKVAQDMGRSFDEIEKSYKSAAQNIDSYNDQIVKSQGAVATAQAALTSAIESGNKEQEKIARASLKLAQQQLREKKANANAEKAIVTDIERIYDRAAKSIGRAGNAALGKNGLFSGSSGQKIQNVSYQLQDVAVQAELGTDAMRILSQQGPQLLGALGPVGALAGVFVGIGAAVAPLIVNIESTKTASDSLKESIDILSGSFDVSRGSIKGLNADMLELLETDAKYAQLKLAQSQVEVDKALAASREAIKEYSSVFTETIAAINYATNDGQVSAERYAAETEKQMTKLGKTLGVSKDQAKELFDSYKQFNLDGDIDALAEDIVTMGTKAGSSAPKLLELSTQIREAQRTSESAAKYKKELERIIAGVGETADTTTYQVLGYTEKVEDNTLAMIEANRQQDIFNYLTGVGAEHSQEMQDKILGEINARHDLTESNYLLAGQREKELSAVNELGNGYDSMVKNLQAQIDAVGMSGEALAVHNAVSRLGTDATDEQRAAVEKLASELYGLSEAAKLNSDADNSLQQLISQNQALAISQIENDRERLAATQAAELESYRVKYQDADNYQQQLTELEKKHELQRAELRKSEDDAEQALLSQHLDALAATYEQYGMSQAEKDQARFDQELAHLNELYTRELITHEEFLKAKENLDKAYSSGRVELEKQVLGDIAGMGIEANEESGDGVKALFAVQQGAAIALATLNAATAYQDGYASSTGTNTMKIAAGIAAQVKAVSEVAKVAAVTFNSGAFHGGVDEVPAEYDNKSFYLKAGERVVAPEANKKLTSFLDNPERFMSGSAFGDSDQRMQPRMDSEVKDSVKNDAPVKGGDTIISAPVNLPSGAIVNEDVFAAQLMKQRKVIAGAVKKAEKERPSTRRR
ncbi:hypothetical protein [Vibrio sp. WXL210]|uniref:hypothetical protein n=1 Tax=Vibrio sp. WXL210 TaxID=3450709 RepID=UPI003EC64E01